MTSREGKVSVSIMAGDVPWPDDPVHEAGAVAVLDHDPQAVARELRLVRQPLPNDRARMRSEATVVGYQPRDGLHKLLGVSAGAPTNYLCSRPRPATFLPVLGEQAPALSPLACPEGKALS